MPLVGKDSGECSENGASVWRKTKRALLSRRKGVKPHVIHFTRPSVIA